MNRFFSFAIASSTIAAASAAVLALGACSSSSTDADMTSAEPIEEAASNLQRNESPNVPDADLQQLVDGTNQFAFALFNDVTADSDRNELVSPLSISTALAMTYAGAAGETAKQMAQALHYDLPPERLHPAFNELDLSLAASAKQANADLDTANAVWAGEHFGFQQAYLDTLAVNYGAGVKLVDFGNPKQAAAQINRWTSIHTHGKISKLVSSDGLNQVVFMLTNAVYFNAKWKTRFEESATTPTPFAKLDGSSVDVPMMSLSEDMKTYEKDGVQAVQIPYEGDTLAMVVVLPPKDRFSTYKSNFDAKTLTDIRNNMVYGITELRLPKFSFEGSYELSASLQSLGMQDAFDPGKANFSKITASSSGKLYIDSVIHKTFIDVTEQGTEAAGATAVGFGADAGVGPSPTPVYVRVDHPFLFSIVDTATNMVLFNGQVTDPSAGKDSQ